MATQSSCRTAHGTGHATLRVTADQTQTAKSRAKCQPRHTQACHGRAADQPTACTQSLHTQSHRSGWPRHYVHAHQKRLFALDLSFPFTRPNKPDGMYLPHPHTNTQQCTLSRPCGIITWQQPVAGAAPPSPSHPLSPHRWRCCSARLSCCCALHAGRPVVPRPPSVAAWSWLLGRCPPPAC